MMAAILNSAILDSAILHKKNFTDSHNYWFSHLNLARLDSEPHLKNHSLSLHSESDSN